MTRLTLLLSLTALAMAGALIAVLLGPDVPAGPARQSPNGTAEAPPERAMARCMPGPDDDVQPDARAEGDRVEALERELAAARQRHADLVTRHARQIAALEARLAKHRQHADTMVRDTGLALRAREDDVTTGDRDAVLFALEEHLAMQPADPDWERAIELDLFELFAESSGLDGNALVHTSCGRTFCRVEFEHADAGAESRLLAAVARQAAWSADYQDVFQYRPADGDRPDDAATSVFFVSRKGHTLPMAIDRTVLAR